VGNYTVAPFYTLQSPEYVTVQSGLDSNLNGDSAGDRVVLNSSGVKGTGTGVTALTNSSGATVGYLANSSTAQFITAGAGALANSSRNTLPLPRIDNIDLSTSKGLNFGERLHFQFTAQAFNVLNHHQFVAGRINDVATDGAFVGDLLHPSGTNFNQPSTVFSSNPRTMQLTAKIIF
jgi:hypothetical protein